jgi:MFS family permease
VPGLPTAVTEAVGAFRQVFRNADLRRVELAVGGYWAGDWAMQVALAVYAYRVGGAFAVGLIALIRVLPAGISAPFAGLILDRVDRQRALLAMVLVRAVVVAGTAVAVLVGAPSPLVYVLTALAAFVSSIFRPAVWSVLPQLAETPGQLVAANATWSIVEAVATLAGPALAGFLLAVSQPGYALVASAAMFGWSTLLVAAIRRRGRGETAGYQPSEVLRGLRAVVTEPRIRLIVGLFGAQTLVRGSLNVLLVVASLRLLDAGEAGVGYLTAAIGGGGIAGAGAALLIVARRRYAGPFALGLALWGIPIALLAAVSSTWLALPILGVAGVGNALLDVAGITLLQRVIPNELRGRVFAALEGIVFAAVGLGAIVTPKLIHMLGTRGAALAVGVVLPALAVAFLRQLMKADESEPVPADAIALLRRVPMFAPLQEPALERLAFALAPTAAPAGTDIVRAGDGGDRFYVVETGELDVRAPDGRLLPRIGPGGFFGEIALLRDVPRTATVTSRTPVRLQTLARAPFLEAVTGVPMSARAADALVDKRLRAAGPAGVV